MHYRRAGRGGLLSTPRELDQVAARPRHPRADRAHRTAAHGSRLRVAEAEDLCQDECLAPAAAEAPQEIGGGSPLSRIGATCRLWPTVPVPPPLPTPGGAEVVKAGVPGDADQPCRRS